MIRMCVLVPAVAFAFACDSTEDPFTSGPAGASVAGLVSAPGGAPVTGTTVRIACAGGGASLDVVTDSSGRYGASLESGVDPFDGGSGSLACTFLEPATGQPRARVDTVLGFARGPVLRALQRVNLQEH